jgi:tetratricopeptide (TPR) repeat protein
VRQHLNRLEFSDTFDNLEHQRRLLRLLIEQRLAGRQDQLSQSEIVGMKMVGRPGKNQRQELLFPDEQAVRTHIGRLRKSLLVYYKYEGASEPIQIDIPKRKYIATFSGPAEHSPGPRLDLAGAGTSQCSFSQSDYQSSELLNKSAVNFYKSGQYAEAEPILQRVLAIREESLGPDHPDTATSLNNLAMLYEKQGRHREALPLLERALAICERTLGPEHPDTLISLNNLAIGFISHARYNDAIPIMERALAIRERSLGPNHPDTACSLNNLAMLYEKLGQYRDAVPVLQRAIAIREQSLGREHPDTATSLNNLAMVYKKLAMFTEAAELSQRALAICEKVLGSEHPETVIVRSNYADLVQEHAPAAPE